ncbi:hypothetical protein HYV98_01310 [Candidatus Azambacteria bacterium]|nr:hypothetical protein [Candidatus Azambacteria bacterium]
MQRFIRTNEEQWFHGLNGELWFRPSAENGLRRGGIAATPRLGDRLIETPACREKCYAVGQGVRLRIFDRKNGFGPWEAPALITGLRVMRLGELTQKDLERTEFEGVDPEGVRITLKEYYGRDITWDDAITIVAFSLGKEASP